MRTAGAHDGPSQAPDSMLAEVAAELRVIDHRAGWSRTLAIGELILKHFFNGNVKEWRTHRRDKDASIRRLAQRSDCPLGRSALSEAVAVYVASREFPGGKIRDELTPSHLAAALRVDTQRRNQLLELAVVRRWTVRELRSQICALKKSHGEKRGRPRSSPQRAALTHAKNAVLMLSRASALLHAAHSVQPDLVRSLEQELALAEEKASGALASLAELSGGLKVTMAPTLSKARAEPDERKRAAG